MSEYQANFNDKAAPYVAGAGLYYIFYWVCTFYPAFIISLSLKRLFFGVSGTEADFLGTPGAGGADVFSFLVMVIGTFVILGLIKCKQYFIVMMLYLLTSWPFLYILGHFWRNAGEMDQYPLPLDFWPLW